MNKQQCTCNTGKRWHSRLSQHAGLLVLSGCWVCSIWWYNGYRDHGCPGHVLSSLDSVHRGASPFPKFPEAKQVFFDQSLSVWLLIYSILPNIYIIKIDCIVTATWCEPATRWKLFFAQKEEAREKATEQKVSCRTVETSCGSKGWDNGQLLRFFDVDKKKLFHKKQFEQKTSCLDCHRLKPLKLISSLRSVPQASAEPASEVLEVERQLKEGCGF